MAILLAALAAASAITAAAPSDAAHNDTYGGSSDTQPVSTGPDDAVPAPSPPLAPSVPAPRSPYLLGDWLGLRTRLTDSGIEPIVGYVGESAANLNQGTSNRMRLAGELALGAKFDMERIAGIRGQAKVLFTKRMGQRVNDESHLNTLQSAQEIWGRGNIWRLTFAWYDLKLGKVDIKAGRMTPAEDSDTARCDFQNLYFCGAIVGHVNSDVYLNYPIGQWGARVKVALPRSFYASSGIYLLNSRNLTDGFSLRFSKASGILAYGEVGATPKIAGRLAGEYKVGMIYSTQDGNDLILDDRGGIRAQTGRPALVRPDRVAFYANLRQQVLAPRADGAHGLALSVLTAYSPNHVTNLESKLAVIANYSGLVPGRPKDDLGIGFARGRLNHHLTDDQERQDAANPGAVPIRKSEYLLEVYYGIELIPGFTIRPHVQRYFNPGGDPGRHSITLLGVKFLANL